MSYAFDGSGAANLNVATPIADTPISMACWFKAEADAAGHALMCLGNESNSEIFRLSASFDVGGDPVVFRATTSGGTNSNLNTTGGATLNTWHHAGCVAASSISRAVYLDGANKASVGSGVRTITSATRLAIGAMFQNGSYGADTQGKIAHAAVWSIDLGDADWAALAAGANPLTIQPDHLVEYWSLLDGLVGEVGALTLTNGGGATLDTEDNPPVDAPPGGAVTPKKMVSESVMSAPSVTVDGTVTPRKMVSESVMSAPMLRALRLLADDQDGDSYDRTTTQVIGNTLYLEGYYDGIGGVTGWVNTNGRMTDGHDGASYSVVIDASGKQNAGAPPGNNNTTGSPWSPILEAKYGGVWDWSSRTKLTGYSYNSTTKVIEGSFAWPAGAEEVRVSYKPVFPVAEIYDLFDEIYASPHAIEPPSAVAAGSLPFGVFARLDHGTGANLVPAGTLDYPCVRVGTGPIAAAGIIAAHSQEGISTSFAQQFMRWMVGSSAGAIAFRAWFHFDLYPHNLSGLLTGRTRANADVGADEDSNREYDSSNSEQTNALKSASETHDAPSGLGLLFDFHGLQAARVDTEWATIYRLSASAGTLEFSNRVRALISGVDQFVSTNTGTGMEYGHLRGAVVSSTLEFADAAPGYPDPAAMYDALAAAVGETLVDMAEEGYFGALALPGSMVSQSVMSAPALAAYGTVSPAGMVSQSVMSAPSVSTHGAVAPGGMVSQSVMSAPTLSAYGTVVPAGMVSESVMSSPAISVAGAVLPGKMVSVSAMSAPALASHGSVQPGTMVSASEMKAPGLSVSGAVVPGKMVSLSEMRSPALAVFTSAMPGTMISLSEMGSPSIGVSGLARPGTMVSPSVMSAPSLVSHGAVQPGTMVSASFMNGLVFHLRTIMDAELPPGRTIAAPDTPRLIQ